MRTWFALALAAGCPTGGDGPTDEGSVRTTLPEPVACFESEDVPPLFTTGLGTEGASRALDDGIEICSDGAGLGDVSDGIAYAFQRAIGPLDVQTTVLALDAGTAALMMRSDDQSADRARASMGVTLGDDGVTRVVARVRPSDGQAETVHEEGPAVDLPVTLHLRRDDTMLELAFTEGDGPQTVLWTGPNGGRLAKTGVAIGLAQASGLKGSNGRATFAPLVFERPSTPPPDVDECAPTTVPHSTDLVIAGLNLDHVDGATVGGLPASIVAQGPDEITLRPRPSDLTSGVIQLTSADWGPVTVRGHLAVAGRPFVRGDLTGDDTVDTADLAALGDVVNGTRSAYRCPEAADVDADGDIDEDDLNQLRAHLGGGGPAPAAPYPDPGAPDGTFVCGLPEPPVVTAVLGADGSSLATGAALTEGDELIVVVSNLPEPASRFEIRFGDVTMEVVETDATGIPGALRVRTGVVPTSGPKCPVWSDDPSRMPRSDDGFIRKRPGRATFGLFELPESDPALCPRFTSSGVANLNQISFDDAAGEMFLPFRDSAWATGDRMQIDIDLPMPFVWGGARGSRRASFEHRIAGETYEERLQRLAEDLRHAIEEDPSCTCDVSVRPDAGRGGIVFEPCAPQIEEPPGPLVPPNLPYKPIPPRKWSGTSFKPPTPPAQPVSCNDVGTYADAPRQFMWCAFADIVTVNDNAEPPLPRWEWFHPNRVMYAYPSVNAYFDEGFVRPDQRPVEDKDVLYNGIGLSNIYQHGYHDPCAQAARFTYCNGSGGGLYDHRLFMPPFDPSAVVVKGFWVPFDRLPATANPDDFYSYQPPSGPRQYLGGLHVNVAVGDRNEYWRWATFWVPKPEGDTTDKSGGPLVAYHDACTVGTGADRPAELAAPWNHYVMCTDDTGLSRCGNPYAPANECLDLSCTECHEGPASWVELSQSGGPLFPAWFPTLADEPGVQACLEEIEAANDQGEDLYLSKAPWECQ